MKANTPNTPMETAAADPALVRAQRDHDLRNMLMPAVGWIDVLLKEPTLDEPTRHILTTVASCLHIATSIVTSSKVNAAEHLVAARTIDLAPVFTLALQLSRMSAPENIALVVHRPSGPVFITASEGLIFRALISLLTNAIHAITPHPGRITATCGSIHSVHEIPRTTHDVYELSDTPYAFVRVSDTGHGMKDEHVLFAHHTPFTTKSSGTGFGLTTVRDLVERTGGGLHIVSEVGVGSTFTIFLPMNDRVTPATGSASGIHVIPTGQDNG